METILQEAGQDRHLIFSVGDARYAMSISHILEIIEMMPVTVVPSMPLFIAGIINLRGAIIPVMDMRARFGYEPVEYDERTCIIVVENEGMEVGLIVDEVQEVTDIYPENIVDPPNTGIEGREAFVKGVGKVKGDVQLILDCGFLLDCAI